MTEAGETAPTTAALRVALRAIIDPASGLDIVAAGLVEGIELRGGNARFIGKSSVVEIIGLPTFGEDAAGVTHQGGECPQI